MYADKDYIISLRREIHRFPEVGFDLPNTVAIVKRELTALGIEFTEKFGKGSVVATINPEKSHFTIGIRADMDALLIEEQNDDEYRSQNPGKMHACGHDAHTAMLLGAAKALQSMSDKINCRVKLLFQPSEEGIQSGAEMMVKNGVMDDIDIIIGAHVENWLDSGTIGVCKGSSMASSRSFKLEVFGKSAHATLPHSGKDALAAAVELYTKIQFMLTREIDPFQRYVCSVCTLNAGTSQNIIADYASMLGTIRAYEMSLDSFIIGRIRELANSVAHGTGTRIETKTDLKAFVVYNDPQLSDLILAAAEQVAGKENAVSMVQKLSSEDFSQYLTKKPGVFFRVGTRNVDKGITSLPHNSDFRIDEDALPGGCDVFVQFVLDNMNKDPESFRIPSFSEKK
ncbi:MAG: amidohydrolase [Clostridiales bacterium]|nr:amidohydrolase [Clostridiales bacterium]